MRLRVAPAILLGVVVVCGSSPLPVPAASILLITGGDTSNDNAISSVLQSQGNTVTVGPIYSDFTGAGLSGYNAVMLVPNGAGNGAYNAPDMPTSGQQALVNFVDSGGGLVTGEPVLTQAAWPGNFKTLAQVFPAYDGGANTFNSPLVFTASTTNPVINAGLPSTFSFAAARNFDTETYLLPKTIGPVSNVTSFYSTNQWNDIPGSSFRGVLGAGSALVGGTYGLGRVINMSTPSDNMALGDPNYDRLLANSVSWVTGSVPDTSQPFSSPPANTVPEPSTLVLFGLVAAGLALRSRRRAAPADARRGLTSGSGRSTSGRAREV